MTIVNMVGMGGTDPMLITEEFTYLGSVNIPTHSSGRSYTLNTMNVYGSTIINFVENGGISVTTPYTTTMTTTSSYYSDPATLDCTERLNQLGEYIKTSCPPGKSYVADITITQRPTKGSAMYNNKNNVTITGDKNNFDISESVFTIYAGGSGGAVIQALLSGFTINYT